MGLNFAMRGFFATLMFVGFCHPAVALEGPFKEKYQANVLVLDNLAGSLQIDVGGKKISVKIDGRPEELDALTVAKTGDTVRIESAIRPRHVIGDITDYAQYRLKVPRGTKVIMDEMIVRADIDDLDAELVVGAAFFEGKIGDVRTAKLHFAGGGQIKMTKIETLLDLTISGSAAVIAKKAQTAKIKINGGGDFEVDTLTKGLSVKASGSGKVRAGEVTGPVSVAITGSGLVAIEEGRADPLSVQIVGSGSVDFGGHAVNPHVSVAGLGDVALASYSGTLKKQGQARIRVGR